MKYSGNNRPVSKKYWKLFHKGGYAEKDLIEMLGDQAKFDENEELTFGTLHKYADMQELGEDAFPQALQSEIPKKPQTFDGAMAFLNDFKQNSQFYGEYMPSFTINEKGQCLLQVVPKNENNEKALFEEVRKLCVRDRLVFYLNRAGVAVDFIDKEDSRYSTEINIDQAADGLYHLINIGNGSVDINADLAEEAGHFAYASLGQNPLVQRLSQILKDPKVREEIKQSIDPEKSKVYGTQEDRELAGVLIGKALLKELNNTSVWARLANRIANLAKRIFYSLKGDEIKLAVLEANKQAANIA